MTLGGQQHSARGPRLLVCWERDGVRKTGGSTLRDDVGPAVPCRVRVDTGVRKGEHPCGAL